MSRWLIGDKMKDSSHVQYLLLMSRCLFQDGNTPVLSAALRGHANVAAFLVYRNADVSITNAVRCLDRHVSACKTRYCLLDTLVFV